ENDRYKKCIVAQTGKRNFTRCILGSEKRRTLGSFRFKWCRKNDIIKHGERIYLANDRRGVCIRQSIWKSGHTSIKKIDWLGKLIIRERINGRHTVEDIVVSGKFASVGLVFAELKAGDFDKASELMTMLGIDYAYGRPYEKCSQGEKQKILIARGLMRSEEHTSELQSRFD